jgi:hypothetical protein
MEGYFTYSNGIHLSFIMLTYMHTNKYTRHARL